MSAALATGVVHSMNAPAQTTDTMRDKSGEIMLILLLPRPKFSRLVVDFFASDTLPTGSASGCIFPATEG